MVLIFADKQTDVATTFTAPAKASSELENVYSQQGPVVEEQQPQPTVHQHQPHHAPQMYGYGNYQVPQQTYSPMEMKQRYLLAERYKTKMCRNYMTQGHCPYTHRCMFAHGQHELRTTDMNVRDGLMTEEAIKSFQRAMTAYNRGELAQQQQSQQGAYAPENTQQQEIARLQAQAEACPCDDCRAAAEAAVHNPYYTAVPSAIPYAQ